jgi:hypothetical protein
MEAEMEHDYVRFDPIKIVNAAAAVTQCLDPDEYSAKEIRAVLLSLLAFTLSRMEDPLALELELIRINRILREGDIFLNKIKKDAVVLMRAAKQAGA